MPMPIGNLDEYDKVVNVSWFTPDKPREELTYVCVYELLNGPLMYFQIPMCIAVLANVPSLLHRHKEFPKSVLFLLR